MSADAQGERHDWRRGLIENARHAVKSAVRPDAAAMARSEKPAL
jgi:hypothetical protein